MFCRLSTLKINSLSNVFLRMTLAQKKIVGKMHIPEKFFKIIYLIYYGYNHETLKFQPYLIESTLLKFKIPKPSPNSN